MPVKSPRKSRKSPVEHPGDDPTGNAGKDVAVVAEEELLFPEATSEDKIRIQRLDDYSKEKILHGYMTYEEQTESRVAELWGGGKYLASLMVRDDRGRWVVKRSKYVTILGTYKRPAEIHGLGGGNAPTPTAAVPSGPPGIAAVEGVYRATHPAERMSPNEALNAVLVNQVLETVKASKEVTHRDIPWDRLFDIGIKLVEVFGNRNESKIETELAEIRAKLNQPAAGPVTSGIGDVAKAIESLMDVRDRIKGVDPEEDGERGGSLWKLAEKVVTMIQQQQAPADPLQGKENIVVEPGRSVPAPPPPVASSLPMWQQMLRHYRTQLVDAARADFDAGFIADMAATKIPPDLRGVVTAFLQRPDAAAIAVSEIPELAEFPAWNTTFWSELRTAVLGEPEVPDAVE